MEEKNSQAKESRNHSINFPSSLKVDRFESPRLELASANLKSSMTTFLNTQPDWSGIRSRLAESSNLGLAAANLQSGMAAYLDTQPDWSGIRSRLAESSNLGLVAANLQSGMAAYLDTQPDWPGIRSRLAESSNLGLVAANLQSGMAAYLDTQPDWSGIRSRLVESTDLRLVADNLKTGIAAFGEMDWTRLDSLLAENKTLNPAYPRFDKIADAYKNNISNALLYGESLKFSQSLSVMNELSQEIRDNSTSLEETNLSKYSEENIQFVLNSLEEWVSGEISFKNIVKRVKGNTFAWLVVTGLMVNCFWHLFFIFTIIDDKQIQQDRAILDSIQSYVETEVGLVKLYKKSFANSNDWTTSRTLGITRKEIKVREGRSKTAPVISDGIIDQRTILFMFETRNSWRKVEVKIKGEYVQGWVPESTIVKQLKKFSSN